MRRVFVRAEAQADLKAACDWYERHKAGLADELFAEFEATAGTIQRSPESFRAVRRSIRRAMMRRFPYAVYFIVQGDAISIFAVVHTARHSRAWRSRL